MAIPTGLPAWARATTIEDVGGHANKRNLMDIGMVNAKSDFSAEAIQRMAEHVTSAVMTAPLFWLVFQYFESGPPCAVSGCATMWGGLSGAYDGDDPPSDQFPTVEAGGGLVVVSFPGLTTGGAIVATDVYGVSSTVEWVAPVATGQSPGTGISSYSATTITIAPTSNYEFVTLMVR